MATLAVTILGIKSTTVENVECVTVVENRGVYGENYDALISSVSLVSERAGLSGKFDPQQPPCHSYNRFGRKYGPLMARVTSYLPWIKAFQPITFTQSCHSGPRVHRLLPMVSSTTLP